MKSWHSLKLNNHMTSQRISGFLTVDAPLVEVFAVLFGYIPLTHIYSVGKFRDKPRTGRVKVGGHYFLIHGNSFVNFHYPRAWQKLRLTSAPLPSPPIKNKWSILGDLAPFFFKVPHWMRDWAHGQQKLAQWASITMQICLFCSTAEIWRFVRAWTVVYLT